MQYNSGKLSLRDIDLIFLNASSPLLAAKNTIPVGCGVAIRFVYSGLVKFNVGSGVHIRVSL